MYPEKFIRDNIISLLSVVTVPQPVTQRHNTVESAHK